jgi:hypothetical protein
MSSQTPNNAAVTASTSADTPASAIPIYGCSISRRVRLCVGAMKAIAHQNMCSLPNRVAIAERLLS